MGDDSLRIRDHLLGLIDGTLRCGLVKRYKEAFLDIDGADTGDGGDEQKEVADQLHGCDVAKCINRVRNST